MPDILTILAYVTITALVLYVVFETYFISTRVRKAIEAGKLVTPASQTAKPSATKVLVIGDSTAYGTGASVPERSLVGMLARNFPYVTIVNESENAMNIKRLREKLGEIATRNERFDVVMIHIGGVDTLSLTPLSTIRRELDQTLKIIDVLGAREAILVSVNNPGNSPLFRFPLSALFSWRGRVLSRFFASYCDEHGVTHVPLFRERHEDPLIRETGHLFSVDCTHPNDAGYGEWYRMIHVHVAPLMRTNDRDVNAPV